MFDLSIALLAQPGYRSASAVEQNPTNAIFGVAASFR